MVSYRLASAVSAVLAVLSTALPAQETLVLADPDPIPGMARMPGELLVNRGFEMASPGASVPSGWSGATFGTETTLALDREHVRSGVFSARITGAPGGSRGGLSRSFGPEATDPKALYLMSAWVRVDGTSESSLGTSVRFTSISSTGVVLKSDYRRCAPGPFDWRFHRWLVALPENTARFNIVLFHHGQGTAWWDDVSLRRTYSISALAPAFGSAVDDSRPEFRWEAPEDATGKLVIQSTGADSFHAEYSVKGDRFRSDVPLPQGHAYQWYVLLDGRDGSQLAAFVTDDGPVLGEFFAGNWQERIRAKLGDLTPYRELYRELKPLADRNGMWDRFSLLGDLLVAADALEQGGELPDGTTVDGLISTLDELKLRAPWWRKVFLGDKDLVDGLRLDLPELSRVKDAVDAEDFPRVRRELLAYYRHREGPSYYRKWESRPPVNPARTTDVKAEKLLTHQMPIHSYEEPTFDLTPEFNWHVFPIIDVEWPTKIHRHFHWSALAGAYWSTDNDAYAREIALQLLDWGQDNPMERWDRKRYRWAWSTLNATIRIYGTWTNAWLRIRSSEAWTPDAQFAMLTLLREHGRFLMTHHASTGNWVVAEARGLVELGIMFPEFKEAESWVAEGFRRLRHEIDLQVLADGIHVERTPGYHSMTLSCFLEPLKLALLNRVDFESKDHFLEKLESMYELYLYGCRPDLRMAQIGDGGPMSVVSLLRKGWDMFGREDMLYVATAGAGGAPPVHRSYAFEAGGFYVSRSDWADTNALWSIMDWGGFVGHCHEDMGQICLYAYGAPLLIDSGRYSYAWPMRKYFHWTIGHNTVLVDQLPQKRRDPLACRWITGQHFDLVRGLTDNSEPLLHERTLVFKQPGTDGAGYWVVLDRLTGSGTHRLDQRWHAGEKLTGGVAGNTVVFTGKPDAGDLPSLTVSGLSQPALATAIEEGWVSYTWYKKQPVEVAQFTLETEMPAVFVTVLYPTPAGVPPTKVTLTSLPAQLAGRDVGTGEATAFEVAAAAADGTTRDLWLFRHTDTGAMVAGDVHLDGRMARIRLGAPVDSWMVAESARLSYAGADLFRSEAPVAAVSRVGDAVFSTAAKGLKVSSAVACRINGGALAAPRDGIIEQTTVSPPDVPIPPKSRHEVNIEIPPPPELVQPTGFAAVLAKEAELPANAIMVNATEFSAQEGGAVEATSRKVGTTGRAFLHWDRAGHWIEYTVAIPTAGAYQLLLRACTAEAAVLRRVTLDGEVPKACAAQELAGTGGYSGEQDDWRVFAVADTAAKPMAFPFPAGDVRIRVENVDGRSLNLNWLAVVAVQE